MRLLILDDSTSAVDTKTDMLSDSVMTGNGKTV